MQALQMIAGQGGCLNIFLALMIWCRLVAPTFIESRYGRRILQWCKRFTTTTTETGFAIA